jgi:hypothetical protein
MSDDTKESHGAKNTVVNEDSNDWDVWHGAYAKSRHVRPLLSALASSLHCLEAWLLRVQTTCSRKDRRDEDASNPFLLAEDNLPNMNGPRLLLQNFLNSVSKL